jgi:uncharacterized protein YdeI (YjbR/CyaY-like superfamily)
MRNPKHDAYIKAAAPFAQPILTHLRELVHKACPEVEETVKWGFPHFDYKGVLCSMAAFKSHCAFGFWKSALMKDSKKVMSVENRGAMGNFDRITSLADLPSDNVLIAYVKEAKKLNDEEVKLPPRKKSTEKLTIPSYFLKAIKANTKAWKTFENFSPSNKREYVEWTVEAKTDATRDKRMETAIEWIAEGKVRNWKYMKKRMEE